MLTNSSIIILIIAIELLLWHVSAFSFRFYPTFLLRFMALDDVNTFVRQVGVKCKFPSRDIKTLLSLTTVTILRGVHSSAMEKKNEWHVLLEKRKYLIFTNELYNVLQ